MTDDKLGVLIGTVLRTGVLTAAMLVAVSGVLYLIQHHADPVRYGTFRIEDPDLRTLHGIWRSVLRLESEATIQLGLVLLIATPIARVALAAVGFWVEGDHLYVAVGVTVLSILMFSLLHST